MFKKILVPTDGSEFSRRALIMALKMARMTNASIELLHVAFTPHAHWGYTFTYGINANQEELDSDGELALEATIKGMNLNQVQLEKKLIHGHPVTAIVEEIEKGKVGLVKKGNFDLFKKENFDLVVMGSHSCFLDSVSKRVLDRTRCPVLIVK